GLLQLNGRREGMFSPEIVAQWERRAGYLAVALAKSKADEKIRRQNEILSQNQARFKLLSETSSQLLASANPQAIVEKLCRQVMQHLDCHAFFNFMVDETMGMLHL